MPALVLSPWSKRWWSTEVEHTRVAMMSAHHRWQKMHLPHHHEDYYALQNKHFRIIHYAKDSLWKEYLSQAAGADIWAAFCYTNYHCAQATPPIISQVGTETCLCMDFESKV
jgi:hypothetical protein